MFSAPVDWVGPFCPQSIWAQRVPQRTTRCGRVANRCTAQPSRAGTRWPKGLACNNGPLHSKDRHTSGIDGYSCPHPLPTPGRMRGPQQWQAHTPLWCLSGKRHYCPAPTGQHSLPCCPMESKAGKAQPHRYVRQQKVPCSPLLELNIVTPLPTPCIRYALVHATAGVGTVYIWYLI